MNYPVTPSAVQPTVSTKTHSTKLVGSSPKSEPKMVQPTRNLDNMEVKYDQRRKEVIFKDSQPCPVWAGDWVVITTGTCSFQQVRSV